MIYLYPVFLIVFGFAVTAVLGLFASWVDRKVTARVQYRVGPPLLQPLIDLVKLSGKETLIPAGASRSIFLTAPLIGLTGVVVVSTILWVNDLFPSGGFLGDWIVAIYFLTTPAFSLILGGFASANPYASTGASREMKLVAAYELPFILAALVPVIQADFSLSLGAIVEHQAANGVVLTSLSGVIAFIVIIISMQAKLGLVPFDVSEAETELAGGPIIEYSGTPLMIYRLMRNMLLFTIPFFVIILFWGGIVFHGWSILWGLLKFIALVAIITVIRNTNPRVRIDQAVRFFWGPVTILALIAVILALVGW